MTQEEFDYKYKNSPHENQWEDEFEDKTAEEVAEALAEIDQFVEDYWVTLYPNGSDDPEGYEIPYSNG